MSDRDPIALARRARYKINKEVLVILLAGIAFWAVAVWLFFLTL